MKFLAALAAALALPALEAAPSRAASAPERIRVALSTKDYGYLPLFVGIGAGFFRDEGLEVQWLVVNTNVVVTALMAGEIDVAGAAGSAMRAAARGGAPETVFFHAP